ncbi:MAG: peptidoglycan bridge formation glycyltransferase FemA/FemB family protein [Candidatus Dormibacteria bacterium]
MLPSPAVVACGSGVPPQEWDSLITEQDGHFLQGRAWAAFRVALGDELLWAHGAGWCWLGQIRSRPGLRDLYLPYGPAAATPLGLRRGIEAAAEVARDNRIHFLRVEPWRELDAGVPRSLGARETERIQPQHTWIVDLAADPATLLSNLTENRRRDVRNAEKKGLQIRRSTQPADAGIFLRLLGTTAERGHFNVHSDSYYETLLGTLLPLDACSLYLADAGADAFAAIVAFHDDRATYYAHAAADQLHSRRLNAPGPLAWRSMLDAKAAGRLRYDFWGVAPDDGGDHPWAGLSRFKRGFGGRLHTTAGTWDLALSRTRYGGYRLLKRVLP